MSAFDHLAADIVIASAHHPSLDDQVADFLGCLQSETRYFGPTAAAEPKPFRSVIDGLDRTDGLRFAAVGRDRVVGMIRVGYDGVVHVAVAPGRRGQGVGAALLDVAIRAAAEHGWQRLVLRGGPRRAGLRATAERLGCTLVDVGRGRLDVIVPPRHLPALELA